MHLDDLPNEILELIFEQVPTKQVAKNVRPTSRRFAAVVDSLWAKKLRKMNVVLTKCQAERDDFNPAQCCSHIEEEKKRWRHKKMMSCVQVTGHSATVDAVRLFQSAAHRRLCFTGSRDRSMVVWDVAKISRRRNHESWKVTEVPEAHEGWIWEVIMSGMDGLYSCSWDRSVKSWQIANDRIEAVSSKKFDLSIMTVTLDNQAVLCGTQHRKIYCLDPLDGLNTVAELQVHSDTVFDVVVEPGSPYMFSCGRDGRVVCSDKRTWRAVRTYQLSSSTYTQSLSLCQGQLLCGTTGSKLTMLDARDFNVICEKKIGRRGIRQSQLNLGSIMCLMKDRRFKIYTPGQCPQHIATSNDIFAEPAKFDYFNEDLAVTCGSGDILFWTK